MGKLLGIGDDTFLTPGRGRRRLTAAGLALALVVLTAYEPTRHLALVAWLTFNGLIVLAAGGWGLLHPRAVGPAKGTAARWAFAATLFATLAAWAMWDSLPRLMGPVLDMIPPGLIVLWLLVMAPVNFAAFFLLTLPGAVMGVWTFGKRGSPESAPRVGVHVWSILSVTAVAVASLLNSGPERLPLLAAVPTLAALICGFHALRSYDPGQVGRWTVRSLARWFVWRPVVRGRTCALDLRGAAVGAFAAVLAVGMGHTGLLAPIQTRVLVSLVQFHNALLLFPPIRYSHEAGQTRVERERVVLLEMDSRTRRSAVSDSNEAEIQARTIHKLSAWGAAAIVLPTPVTREGPQIHPMLRQESATDAPEPTRADIQQTLRSLPMLATAMRAAGNVILTVTNEYAALGQRRGFDELTVLVRAARWTAPGDLAWFRTPQLLAVPVTPGEPPSAPVLVFAAARAVEPVVKTAGAGEVEIGGTRVSQIEPGKVLLDLESARPGQDFARVSYSGVFADEPLWVPPAYDSDELRRPGQWVGADSFFKGKIVFLDSLGPPDIPTAAGVMSRPEALAYGAVTLLSGQFLSRTNPLSALLWTLLLGAVVGQLCTRKDPFDSGWRAFAAASLVVVVAMVAIMDRHWVDPVVPLVTVFGGALLASQFTFDEEREKNRGLLERFFPTPVVEEFLRHPERLAPGGKRQHVCVIFADVRNFTRYAEQYTPEEVLVVISAYLTAMEEVLLSRQGILDKYMGDGLMAFFPVAEPERDVERAVRAAVAMRDSADEVSRRLAAEGKVPLQFGIGVHYGPAVVGWVGSAARRLDYTAIGHTVIVSHRMQGLAGGGEVIVSESVYLATSGVFNAEEVPPVQVKGIDEPVRPYRVLDAQPFERAISPAALPPPAPGASPA